MGDAYITQHASPTHKKQSSQVINISKIDDKIKKKTTKQTEEAKNKKNKNNFRKEITIKKKKQLIKY